MATALKRFELKAFKTAMDIATIKFHELKTDKGIRFKAFCADSDGNDLEVITTLGFDHKATVYVYHDQDTGLFTFSNKAGGVTPDDAVAFTL